MFARLFHPAVSVTLAGVQVVNLRGEGLRVSFRVRRTMTAQPDAAELAIYNLAPERRKAITALFGELGRANLSIAAGYEAAPVHLFLGDVRAPLRASVLEGQDIVTRATADEGGDVYTEATFSELAALTGLQNGGTSVTGATADEMITAALTCFALKGASLKPPAPPIVRHPSVDAVVAAGPYARQVFNVVAVSKASDLLDEAARILGARWWIRDNQLFMATRGVPTDPLAVLLPRSHWLSEPSEDGAGIVRVSTFLDPTITPGRQVALVGREITAPAAQEFYRVDEAEYAGDTHGGAPWSVGLAMRKIRVGA